MVAKSKRAAKRKHKRTSRPAKLRPSDILSPEGMADPETVRGFQRGLDAAAKAKPPEPEFGVGDIVSIEKGSCGFGAVEMIHRECLILRCFCPDGDTYSGCNAHPIEDCVLVISAADLAALREPAQGAAATSPTPASTIVELMRLAVTIEDRFCRLIGETHDHLTARYHEQLDQQAIGRIKTALTELDDDFAELLRGIIGQETMRRENLTDEQASQQMDEAEMLQEV